MAHPARQAVLLFPSDSKLWIECAKLLTKMGQHGKAITMLQRALDIDSYNPYTYQCLAKLEIKQGNYAEARRLFARGVAMAEAGLKVSLGSEGSDSSLREVLSGHGVADTETGVSKHESAEAPGGGAGAARRKSARMPPDVQGSTVGRRELAALLHEWATFADSQGDSVNTTRAIFQKALELDSQRVSLVGVLVHTPSLSQRMRCALRHALAHALSACLSGAMDHALYKAAFRFASFHIFLDTKPRLRRTQCGCRSRRSS